MKYKAIIFDLDGTLVDSIEDLAESMNAILEEYNLPTHPSASYYGMVGMGIRKLVFNALPDSHRNDEFIDLCFSTMKVLYERNIINKTVPYNGILDLLDRLTENGILLNVLSNKADKLTKKVVENIFSDYHFEFVMGPFSDELRKPNPENALLIASKLEIDPSEIIFLGDTSIDIRTAKNAGMTSVGAGWGFRTRKELVEAGAEYVIDQPMELLDLMFKGSFSEPGS